MDCLLIAADSFWLNPSSWWAMSQVVIGLGFVIFVHELGHFLVAKACGVKCEKFYVGFDFFDIKIGDRVIVPRSLLKWQWGETQYGIGIIPLGGYVKMLGQDDNPGNIEKEIQRSKIESDSGDPVDDSVGWIDRSKIDPRSYLAKSVPQRMAIISAGVIFNLMFAVLFAAIAFKSGVEFEPPVVGDVVPGGPAWSSNMLGASVKRIGDKEVKDYFTYLDMAQEIAFHGNQPLEIEIERPGQLQPETVTVTPESNLREDMNLPLIGVGHASIPQVADDDQPTLKGHPADQAGVKFEKNDLITAIDSSPIKTGFDLKRNLAANFDRPLEFVVQRSSESGQGKSITIHVDRNPRRDTGLTMRWGNVTAIQQGSPAETAGLEVGDQIVSIDGTDKGDLYTLEQRLTKIARDNPSRQVTFAVQRGDQEMTINVAPRIPIEFSDLATGRPVAINSLGIAIETSSIVATSTIPGIEPGDQIVECEFILPDDESKELYASYAKKSKIDLVQTKIDWQTIDSLMQKLPAGAEFDVTVKRGENLHTAHYQTVASSQYFIPTRGIKLAMLEQTYQSATWADAFKYGALQTWSDSSRVWKFLEKLVSGSISPNNLGGPGTIFVVATSEASRGTSRLLLFLTLLSANLAIVNFLPIPVLDGGHFLFLAYEGLFRRPVSEKAQIVLTYAGLIMILGLMAFVLYLDAFRISGMM